MKTYHLYAIISMIFAGFTSVIAKFGLKNISGDAGLAIRTSVVFFFVWIHVLIFQHFRDFSQLKIGDFWFLFLSGITTGLSWIFYYKAIKSGNVSEVALIDKTSIIITLLLSFLILKEIPTWRTLLGALMILGGLAVISFK